MSNVRSYKNSPGIRLLRSILRAERAILGCHAWIEKELPIAEFDMIATLGNTDGLRMSELAALMITSPPNVTRVARALEQRGLVERSRSQDSGREVICRLTRRGETVFGDLYPRAATFTIDVLDRVLARSEQVALERLLERLASGLANEKERPNANAHAPRLRRARAN
jgi:MarR family transcriptional regulator, 2-MHQ and catechol-resistance regulon repressor